MVTCGGQVSIPIIKYITSKCGVSYAEVVTQIYSESAGIATRINIDKYIETTEKAITRLTNVPRSKVILNINPHPETTMQTTVLMKVDQPGDFSDFDEFVKMMKSYVKNYIVESPPTYRNGILSVSIRIVGSGDNLSIYAGNLDVINCAAIEILKKIKMVKYSKSNVYESVLDI